MNNSSSINGTKLPALDSFSYFQIGWQQTCFILGVIGNIYLLHSMNVNKAVKLDKMSLWIINNLAVVDIANCFFILLPILIIQYGRINRHFFGKSFFNYWTPWCYSFFIANSILAMALSLNKLIRCVFPLRNLNTSLRHKFAVTAITAFAGLTTALTDVYAIYSGEYSSEDNFSGKYFGSSLYSKPNENLTDINFRIFKLVVIPIIFCFIPCCLLIVTNIALVFYAISKTKTNINKGNIIIVVLVTTVFLVSYLPEIIFAVAHGKIEISIYSEIFLSLIWLSCWTNPFIYLTVNPHFRRFTLRRFRLSTR